MIRIEEFISDLSRLDVRIRLEDGHLKCDAPKEALTQNLRMQLSERKAEIIDFLKNVNLSRQSSSIAIKPIPRDGELQLYFAQQRLWFLDQLIPENCAYNNP